MYSIMCLTIYIYIEIGNVPTVTSHGHNHCPSHHLPRLWSGRIRVPEPIRGQKHCDATVTLTTW